MEAVEGDVVVGVILDGFGVVVPDVVGVSSGRAEDRIVA